ncbi:MAG TPA: ribosome silencing factor [Deltaproteobacteria bacterium]|nr:ribosome silencing factor [Deltaproteobacteria bacterium]HPP80200.1 ribosome silencing factor [Deltaproteobacteria bacterium]
MRPTWDAVRQALEDRKATDVVVLDVRGVCAFTDYIVICTGISDRQIKAMAEHVIETFGKPFGKEGIEQGRWVLLDYLDVVVHIFQPDLRKYYDIEGMWYEARRIR